MYRASTIAQYLHEHFSLPVGIFPFIDLPLEVATIAIKPITDLRNVLYDNQILSIKKLKRPVISIGNITIGGSGKTPLVQWLSNELNVRGYESVVLSRGYRPGELSISKPCIVDPLNISACELYGDEAVLLAKTSPSKVIVCRDRYIGGKLGEDQLSPSIFILDDGYQHRALYRDCNILVIDSTKSIEQHLFPRGILREGWNGIKRADIVVLSKSNLATQNKLEKWKQFINKMNKVSSVIEMEYSFGEPKKIGLDSLKGERVFVVAAIADPENLSRMLLNLGAQVTGHKLFRDHHLFTQMEITECEEYAKSSGAKFLVTTEKDGIRLRGLKKKLKWIELPLKVELDAQALFSIFKQKGIPCDLKCSEFST